MTQVEYKVVPAPKKGAKAKGIKGADAQFAHAFEVLMNTMAVDGWQYLRSETLPNEARAGLTSVTTTYRNILVFAREVPEVAVEEVFVEEPAVVAAPEEAPKPEADPIVEAVSDDAAPIESQLDADHDRLQSSLDDQR